MDCSNCGKVTKIKCSECRTAYYCNRECQKQHRKIHKELCKKISKDILYIHPEFYISIEKEMKQKYEDHFGVNPDDRSVVKLTVKEMVGKYAEILAFWHKNEQIKSLKLESPGYFKARYAYCAQHKLDTIEKINNFNEELKTAIYELYNQKVTMVDPRTAIYEKYQITETQHRKMMREAYNLFAIAKKDILDDDFPRPGDYLMNQDTFRSSWETYLGKIKNSPINIFINNSFYDYMNYMYNNIPIGYGADFRNVIEEMRKNNSL